MNTFVELQRRELESARAKHGKQASVHEGYAVLLEEVDEFWEEVKKKRSERSTDLMVAELVQIAAMAQRTAEDVLMSSNATAQPRREGVAMSDAKPPLVGATG